MRVLIQQKPSAQYFKDVGQWTPDVASAKDFFTTAAAVDFCVLNKLTDVQIVLNFDQPGYDLVLPLDPRLGNRNRRPNIEGS